MGGDGDQVTAVRASTLGQVDQDAGNIGPQLDRVRQGELEVWHRLLQALYDGFQIDLCSLERLFVQLTHKALCRGFREELDHLDQVQRSLSRGSQSSDEVGRRNEGHLSKR